MSVLAKIWISSGIVWFATKAADHFWPPANPTFNAMLAIITAIGVLAQHLENRQ